MVANKPVNHHLVAKFQNVTFSLCLQIFVGIQSEEPINYVFQRYGKFTLHN